MLPIDVKLGVAEDKKDPHASAPFSKPGRPQAAIDAVSASFQVLRYSFEAAVPLVLCPVHTGNQGSNKFKICPALHLFMRHKSQKGTHFFGVGGIPCPQASARDEAVAETSLHTPVYEISKKNYCVTSAAQTSWPTIEPGLAEACRRGCVVGWSRSSFRSGVLVKLRSFSPGKGRVRYSFWQQPSPQDRGHRAVTEHPNVIVILWRRHNLIGGVKEENHGPSRLQRLCPHSAPRLNESVAQINPLSPIPWQAACLNGHMYM